MGDALERTREKTEMIARHGSADISAEECGNPLNVGHDDGRVFAMKTLLIERSLCEM